MTTHLHGMLAEFDTPTELVDAARKARDAGYTHMDAYSPFPIHELPAALGHPRTRMPLAVLVGGIVGLVGGYLLQYWTAVIAYPLNVGGRPLHSWPAFIPVTFETTILCAALTGIFAMLARNGLPRPHHPLFGVERFSQASRDRFFLCIEATDPTFDLEKVQAFLEAQNPLHTIEVPR